MQDADKELARDIGYALSQSPFKVKGQRIDALRFLAEGVVAHLRRAGWLFSLKPPEPLHGPTTVAEDRRHRGASDGRSPEGPAPTTRGAAQGQRNP